MNCTKYIATILLIGSVLPDYGMSVKCGELTPIENLNISSFKINYTSDYYGKYTIFCNHDYIFTSTRWGETILTELNMGDSVVYPTLQQYKPVIGVGCDNSSIGVIYNDSTSLIVQYNRCVNGYTNCTNITSPLCPATSCKRNEYLRDGICRAVTACRNYVLRETVLSNRVCGSSAVAAADIYTPSYDAYIPRLDEAVFTSSAPGCLLYLTITTDPGKRSNANCRLTQTVIFSNTVKIINDFAFVNNTSLSIVKFASTIEYIGPHAFENTGIYTLNIFGPVVIQEYAFHSCLHLYTISGTSNVIEWGDSSFENCTNLSVIDGDISNSRLYSHIFSGTRVPSVTIGTNVTLGPFSLSEMSFLLEIYVHGFTDAKYVYLSTLNTSITFSDMYLNSTFIVGSPLRSVLYDTPRIFPGISQPEVANINVRLEGSSIEEHAFYGTVSHFANLTNVLDIKEDTFTGANIYTVIFGSSVKIGPNAFTDSTISNMIIGGCSNVISSFGNSTCCNNCSNNINVSDCIQYPNMYLTCHTCQEGSYNFDGSCVPCDGKCGIGEYASLYCINDTNIICDPCPPNLWTSSSDHIENQCYPISCSNNPRGNICSHGENLNLLIYIPLLAGGIITLLQVYTAVKFKKHKIK